MSFSGRQLEGGEVLRGFKCNSRTVLYDWRVDFCNWNIEVAKVVICVRLWDKEVDNLLENDMINRYWFSMFCSDVKEYVCVRMQGRMFERLRGCE